MLNLNALKSALVAAAIACMAPQAWANPVVASTTADLRLAGVSAPYDMWAGSFFAGGANAAAVPAIAPISLSAGDTFELTVSFLAGQQIVASGLQYIMPVLQAAEGQSESTLLFNSKVELLDAGGAVLAWASRNGSETYNNAINELFYGDTFSGAVTPSIAFSGIRFSGLLKNTDFALTYDRASFAVSGVSLDLVTNVSAVPEPTSMALMLAGLASVGVIGRRQRRMTSEANT